MREVLQPKIITRVCMLTNIYFIYLSHCIPACKWLNLRTKQAIFSSVSDKANDNATSRLYHREGFIQTIGIKSVLIPSDRDGKASRSRSRPPSSEEKVPQAIHFVPSTFPSVTREYPFTEITLAPRSGRPDYFRADLHSP